MLNEIENAKTDYPFMIDALDAIAECYSRHGCPEEPVAPSTNPGRVCSLATGDSMGDATDGQVDYYRNAEIALFGACGYVHIGGDNWATQGVADGEWAAYRAEAYDIATEYPAARMWDDFCNA